jgi:hypothetical protein
MLINRWLTIKRLKGDPETNLPNRQKAVTKYNTIPFTRVIVFIALISGYILTIQYLGYFIVTPVFIISVYLFMRASSILNIFIIALSFTLFIYVLFVLFLNLPVPMGLLS